MSLSSPDLTRALEEWTAELGADAVRADEATRERYESNVSGVERHIGAVLYPSTTKQVQAVVRVANDYRVPLFPLSTGCNWGLGSRLPCCDDCVVVELSRMKGIREVEARHHYAVVEPGVTQGQLYDYLVDRALPLALNVTGSSRATSMIGNTLERGIGYFASRADSLSGLEVVLGTGEVVRTGCGHFPTSKITHLYRHGVGPSLDGLFFQSSFGIVTSAGIDLLPTSEDHMCIIATIDDDKNLEPLIDALAALRGEGILPSVAHVGNRNRALITLAPLVHRYLMDRTGRSGPELRKQAEDWVAREGFGPWSAVAGMYGSPEMLGAARKAITRRLRGIATVRVLTEEKLVKADRLTRALSFLPIMERKRAVLNAVQPVFGLSKGVPTDAPMGSVYWPIGEDLPADGRDPDQTVAGMLYCVPFFPSTGKDARACVEVATAVAAEYGFEAHTTLNLVDAKSDEAVITLSFRRDDPSQVAQAQDCVEAMQHRYMEMGFIPYRWGVQYMRDVVDPKDPFWQQVKALKQVFDPNGIIAPGRYCP